MNDNDICKFVNTYIFLYPDKIPYNIFLFGAAFLTVITLTLVIQDLSMKAKEEFRMSCQRQSEWQSLKFINKFQDVRTAQLDATVQPGPD